MTDRVHTEEVLYRVAVAAITYYDGRSDAEPGYTIEVDLDWCMQPLAAEEVRDRPVLRGIVAATITDPTSARQALVRRLAVLGD